MNKLVITIFIGLFLIKGLNAQEGKTNIETSIFWPIFPANLYSLQATTQLGDKGSILYGLQFQPRHNRDDEGDYAAFEARIGYRYFISNKFHADAVLVTGYESLENNVFDGKDYDGVGFNFQLTFGYILSLGERAYLNLQPLGIGYVAHKINEWPLDEDLSTDESPIYLGNILIGLRF